MFSALYYSLLSAKQFTWIFSSGDSGDWLASAGSWFPPQPFGNPLFVLLGHALNALPGDLVVKMTVIGSCIPSAVTVAIVYLIVDKLTENRIAALLSSVMLLSSAVFLSQSTVLSQYPLAVMTVVIAFWFYLCGRLRAVAICLGIGSAMHVVVAVISVFWLIIVYRREPRVYRLIPLYALFGVLPYTLTLWQVTQAGMTPLEFVSNSSGAGSLALSELPSRVLQLGGLLVVSLGVAVIPLGYGVRRTGTQGYKMMLIIVLFILWYYLTASDPTVWHYLPWAMPFLVIFAGIGVVAQRFGKRLILLSVTGLLVANTLFLNADLESRKSPVATELYRRIVDLPEESAVIVPHTGWVGFVFRYAQTSKRPDLLRIEGDDAESIIGRDVFELSPTSKEIVQIKEGK